MATARPCHEFRLDAGYAATPHVPGWMLPAGVLDDRPVALPDLPQVCGYVLTADAIGHEAELIRHFADLPPLPLPAQRHETAAFNCLEVNLLLCLPGEHPVIVDTFAGGRQEADRLLGVLADTDAPPTVLYDNLDQGWALRIVIEPEAVLILDWNWDWDWEASDPRRGARSLRLPRPALANQAAAARSRLHRLHETLVGALGRDPWARPGG